MFRIFVEKKEEFATEATSLARDLNETLNLSLEKVRVINVYDLFDINEEELKIAKENVLSEIVTDHVFDSLDLAHQTYFAVEFLPGQYDQRADSAEQCLRLLSENERTTIKSGKIILLEGVNEEQLVSIKAYYINPIEMREKNLLEVAKNEENVPKDVVIYEDFNQLDTLGLENFLNEQGMAMTLEDITFIQAYFKNEEKRNPSQTELKVLDTYWSDHCRHTTFETIIKKVTFEKGRFQESLEAAFHTYLEMRADAHENKKPMTLMDMATINARQLRKHGLLDDVEVSEEINACSVYIDVDVDGVKEPWLLQFKNETHNHPTEIEPFGGASTCIGGAIRDPLSGRAYVYQAMRISGSGNILEKIEDTRVGKLPQKTISKGATHGNSSYGNQIGLATSFVREIFHEGYKAKHLETGAVVAAAPLKNVVRQSPLPGDLVILLGGKTGRDGVGGATGSSKAHKEDSITTASSEVQKGNAPTERKIQHLFRDEKVTRLIKKCNDFGAGGVAVAIGELADGLAINLDKVPVKYHGLNGTELAISESQERMAVVVDRNDADQFITYAAEENLEAVVVAYVTNNHRLIMSWRGKEIVNLSRNFLNTNGAKQEIELIVPSISQDNPFASQVTGTTFKEKFLNNLKQDNVASLQGMIENFDASIGAGTVLMPFGGKYQLTEQEGSVHKIPVRHGNTNTTSLLTYGYNPFISSFSPFHGAAYAVVESIAKITALGGNWQGIRFSFQEYFKRLEKDAKRWGEPFSALLGAIQMQKEFGLAAIGGKDSMSGSFEELHVPPTLISFAVQTQEASKIKSAELKHAGNYIYLIKHTPKADFMPNVE
ncbi:MAG: phosphoribosylformylglycinamidine synthase, partial [Streptococcaceae bacterium]|nr:phosphoribosylformylglycinamidine synthase [Streptococcaceae bacterium]